MDIKEWLRKLMPKGITIARREKYAIGIAAGIIAIIIVVQLIISPILNKKRRLDRQIEVQGKALQDILELKSEYEAIRKMADAARTSVAGRNRGFTLFSFLDTLAGQSGLKDRIAYMKPSTSIQDDGPFKLSIVETKLQAITMKQLTAYIYRIETSRNMVRVKRLSITKAGRQVGTIDAVLLVETFET
jgi:general secretion pathway protein M